MSRVNVKSLYSKALKNYIKTHVVKGKIRTPKYVKRKKK